HVECAAGLRQGALRHQSRRADGFDAGAEIDADRKDIALRRGLRADPADVIVQQILEFGALALVAGSGHVGEIVGDDLDIELHRHHAGRCCAERAHGFNSPSTSSWNFGELVDRRLAEIALLLQYGGDLGVAAGDFDHARHLDHAAHVRFLDGALHDAGRRRGLRLHAGRRIESAAAVFLQLLRIGERDQPKLAARRIDFRVAFAHADRAVAADRHLPVGRLQRDRAAVAEHRITVAGDELARWIDLHRAVAGVAFAARRLHYQEGVAIHGDIERIAGALDRPLAHIVPNAAVLHEAHAAAGLVGARAGGKIFLEYRPVGLVAGGVEVRDVVGDHVHFTREPDLARQSDETRILHRHSPLLIQPSHALPRPALPKARAKLSQAGGW